MSGRARGRGCSARCAAGQTVAPCWLRGSSRCHPTLLTAGLALAWPLGSLYLRAPARLQGRPAGPVTPSARACLCLPPPASACLRPACRSWPFEWKAKEGPRQTWESYVNDKLREMFEMAKAINQAEKAGGGTGLPPLLRRLVAAGFAPQQLRTRMEKALNQRVLMEGGRPLSPAVHAVLRCAGPCPAS